MKKSIALLMIMAGFQAYTTTLYAENHHEGVEKTSSHQESEHGSSGCSTPFCY